MNNMSNNTSNNTSNNMSNNVSSTVSNTCAHDKLRSDKEASLPKRLLKRYDFLRDSRNQPYCRMKLANSRSTKISVEGEECPIAHPLPYFGAFRVRSSAITDSGIASARVEGLEWLRVLD